MARTIAKIAGVALKPGVSRNNRLYTPEVIAKAVRRAQETIADHGAQPMTTLTHHGAGDDSTRIIGRITGWNLAGDGSARFEADLANTDHANTILNLIDDEDGDPFLKGVSIRGQWLGQVQRKQHGGKTVETGDDLELHGLDYTANPGVVGAQVDSVTRSAGAREATTESRLIFESVTDVNVITEDVDEARKKAAEDDAEEDDATSEDDAEEDDAEEKGAPALKSGKAASAQTKAPKGSYADPGYQDDKMPRYPLNTKARAKAAWSYINTAKDASAYTPAQLKQIKNRIVKALRGYGVKVNTQEGWLAEPAAVVTESLGIGAAPNGSVSLTLDNGMFTISMYSYRIDPADLDVIGRAAMSAACDAVCALDPDMDGDMDVPGAPGEDTDHDMETAGEDDPDGAPATEALATETPAAEVVGDTHESEEEPAMADTTSIPAAAPATEETQAPPAGVISFSPEQFQQLLSVLRPQPAPAESAPAAEEAAVKAAAPTETSAATPVEAPVEETTEQLVARLVREGLRDAVQTHVEQNGVQRKGLVTQETAPAGAAREFDYPDGWPQKPLNQYTPEEQKKYWNPQVEGFYMGQHSVLRPDAA